MGAAEKKLNTLIAPGKTLKSAGKGKKWKAKRKRKCGAKA